MQSLCLMTIVLPAFPSEMTQLTDERKLLMDKFQDKVNEVRASRSRQKHGTESLSVAVAAIPQVEGERKKREEDRNEFLQQQKEKEKAQQLE